MKQINTDTFIKNLHLEKFKLRFYKHIRYAEHDASDYIETALVAHVRKGELLCYSLDDLMVSHCFIQETPPSYEHKYISEFDTVYLLTHKEFDRILLLEEL